jgi:very-short-patch-repair endonuclease
LAHNQPDPLRRAQHKRRFARELRAGATECERKLWALLRAKQFAGLRFRRQQPLGPYIADFYCSAARLVIELDGSQHGTDENVAHDAARTKWMAERGFRVLRFSNEEFLKSRDVVIDAIARAIDDAGVPLPEPRPLRCR